MNKEIVKLIYPQWQGGQNFNYVLGAKVMEAIVPNSEKMDEINVPVSLEKNGDKTSQIDDEAALIKQIQAAQVILEDRNPAKVITIGGDCSTSLASLDYLNGKYHGNLGVLWFDAHPDISSPEQSSHLHEMVISTLMNIGAKNVQNVLKHQFSNKQFLLSGLIEKDLRPMDSNVFKYNINFVTPQVLKEDIAPIIEWINQNNFEAVAVHLDLDVFSPQDFRSIYPAEPGLKIEDFPAAVGEMKIHQVFDILAKIEHEKPLVGMTVAEHLPWDAINLRNNFKKLELFN